MKEYGPASDSSMEPQNVLLNFFLLMMRFKQNLEYGTCVAQYQNLLGWLYNSIDAEVASEVMGNETSKDLWKALETLFCGSLTFGTFKTLS